VPCDSSCLRVASCREAQNLEVSEIRNLVSVSSSLCYCIFLPLHLSFLLFLVVLWSASLLRHWAWRDVILIEDGGRRRSTSAQGFIAPLRSRHIDPNFVFLLPLPSLTPLVIFASFTRQVYGHCCWLGQRPVLKNFVLG
jgi:hypothetical protein